MRDPRPKCFGKHKGIANCSLCKHEFGCLVQTKAPDFGITIVPAIKSSEVKP